jgi:hypothetical protein
MEKLDFKKLYKDLFAAKVNKVTEVTVPKLPFLSVDGAGDPNGAEFAAAVGALYGLSYSLKFWSKKHELPAGWQEFSVAPLEGLWWVAGSDAGPMSMDAPRGQWRWRAMIMQPEFVTADLVDAARAEAAKKKPEFAEALERVMLDTFEEGRSVQIMHVGPYTDEMPNVMKLTDYMAEHGLVSNGLHHEIYLGDPKRMAPDKLKTILRHPVK